jgi:hypothetical protein
MAGFGSLAPNVMTDEDYAALSPETLDLPGVRKAIGAAGNVAQGIWQHFSTPGAVMAPNPYPEGSEAADWYEDQRKNAMLGFAGQRGVAALMPLGATQSARAAVLGSGAIRRPRIAVPPRADVGTDVSTDVGGTPEQISDFPGDRIRAKKTPPSGAPAATEVPFSGAPQYAPTAGTSGSISAGVDAPPNPAIQTVSQPYRMMYPGIYGNPRQIAAEAAAQVGPEDPAMKRLFGVTRGDLYEMGQGRIGNVDPAVAAAGARSRGSEAGRRIMTPENTQRLVDTLAEGGKYEPLRFTDAWYVMDPLHARMAQMFGPAEANPRYTHLNTMTGMASPGSEVESEIQRGTAAHWLEQQGRFKDFLKYGGIPEDKRALMRSFPPDLRYIAGHPYHATSQGGPMEKYLAAGRQIQSESPKVPLYVGASGVPETGFQTAGQVGDAHWSRGVGLSDVRKGPTDVQASFSTPEYQTTQPWWKRDVAGAVGLESVPAQARLWNILGPQTGVESALGAPKLELLSGAIMRAAKRLNVSPETARDWVLSGKAGAGLLAAGAGFGSLIPSGQQEQRQ